MVAGYAGIAIVTAMICAVAVGQMGFWPAVMIAIGGGMLAPLVIVGLRAMRFFQIGRPLPEPGSTNAKRS